MSSRSLFPRLWLAALVALLPALSAQAQAGQTPPTKPADGAAAPTSTSPPASAPASEASKAPAKSEPSGKGARSAADAHLAFVAPLCDLPMEPPHNMVSCSNNNHDRQECLETLLSETKERNTSRAQPKRWTSLDEQYKAWSQARCYVYEERQWVHIPDRTWSWGSRMGADRLCHQRLLEDRIYLHELRGSELASFWSFVESRQALGREAFQTLKTMRERARLPADPKVDPDAMTHPKYWEAFVKALDASLDLVPALAKAHCQALPAYPQCEQKLTFYFHSIPADAEDLDACFYKRDERYKKRDTAKP